MFISNKYNKGKPVNLSLIVSIETGVLFDDIYFITSKRSIDWSFESEEQRDIVYDNILNLIDAKEV